MLRSVLGFLLMVTLRVTRSRPEGLSLTYQVKPNTPLRSVLGFLLISHII